MQTFERYGNWWLPEYRDDVVAGKLTFSATDGAYLQIIGGNLSHLNNQRPISSINSHYNFRPFTLLPFEIILGSTERGELVTLYQCYPIGLNLGEGERYRVEFILLDHHFERPEYIIFENMELHFSHLEIWTSMYGFNRRMKSLSNETSSFDQVEFYYQNPEPIEASLDEVDIYLKFRLIGGYDNYSVSQRQYNFICIQPRQPLSMLDYLQTYVYYLRNFFCFALGHTVIPSHLVGTKSVTKEKIQIFYSAQGASIVGELVDNRKVLFSYPDIHDYFQDCLQNWFKLSRDIAPIIDLYFDRFYINSMYIHLSFLTLAQAIESYHRERYGGVFMSEEEYEAIAKVLWAAIPDNLEKSHLDSLRNRIKYGYEYSFRKRLKALLGEELEAYKEVLSHLYQDKDNFIDAVVNTRNYLTHYSQQKNRSSFDNSHNHYSLTQKLHSLMQLCFLKEIGLPSELIIRLMERMVS